MGSRLYMGKESYCLADTLKGIIEKKDNWEFIYALCDDVESSSTDAIEKSGNDPE